MSQQRQPRYPTTETVWVFHDATLPLPCQPATVLSAPR
jgi:hypothetical protein